MSNSLKMNQPAPEIKVETWVQGSITGLAQLKGQVILIEVFQVNCPGCFLYALPQAITLFERYQSKGLAVIGLATAFEDFDNNNLVNLIKLVENQEVIGETKRVLDHQGLLNNGNLSYRIPFSVGMDSLYPRQGTISETEVKQFIDLHQPNFLDLPQAQQTRIQQQVLAHLKQQDYIAQTFTLYQLQGTPSQILIDKKGFLKSCSFGSQANLEEQIAYLLAE